MYSYKKMRNDAHQFTDCFASLEMSVRVCFEGLPIDIPFAKYCIRRLRLGADVNGRSLPAIAR